MFVRAITVLAGNGLDAGNVNVPRTNDLLYESYARRAADALNAQYPCFSPSERAADPDKYAAAQRARREALESLLWVEPNQESLDRMYDLIDRICREDSWSACGEMFDDPLRPTIDAQAAETGALIAWIYRRHGARIAEACPNLNARMLCEVRRRLIAPVLTYDDYDFLKGAGDRPALILSDIAVTCLLMERTASRRLPPLKLILHTLDRLCITKRARPRALSERLTEACALADLARIMKRITRGEADLTREAPPSEWLDDVLIPWVGRDYFIDPAGHGMMSDVSGMDYFRLGYFVRDRAIAALGASLIRENDRPAASVTGRVLSMEYVRAARDEMSPPPRLRRAAAEDGSIMLSRTGGMLCAITAGTGRSNAGDIVLFSDLLPILIDPGRICERSLPVINGSEPLRTPRGEVTMDSDFKDDRDLMSADLSMCYPEQCFVGTYQRTLMTQRRDQTVRLVDAFEFIVPPAELTFRFILGQRPLVLRDSVRIGSVLMTWDGDMTPVAFELEDVPDYPERCHLLQLRAHAPSPRSIYSFTFEK